MVEKGSANQFPVEEDDSEKYRDTLKQMYDWLKERTSGTHFTNFTQQVLFAILEADDKQAKYDKELLIEYLKNPANIYAKCSQKIKDTLGHSRVDNQWTGYHNIPNF